MSSDRVRNVNIFSGPSSVNFYHDISDKKILILGDYHNTTMFCDTIKNVCDEKNQECYDIDDWLVDLVKYSPNNCFDIFIEEAYYNISDTGISLNHGGGLGIF